MKNIRSLLAFLAVFTMLSAPTQAATAIWAATSRAPAADTMRLPVDTSSSSGPGYLAVSDLKTYIETLNLGNFSATTSSQLAGVISDETGTGPLVFGTTPTLATPILGVATATSINKMAITAPATSS